MTWVRRWVLNRIGWVFVVIALVSACEAVGPSDQPTTAGSARVITGRSLQIVTGQTLYVPAYSEVFYGTRDRTLELAVTLTIHNTDLENPIIMQAVQYYDSDGGLVRDYVTEPVEVGPLATIGYVVPESDRRGGFGANFVVTWGAEQPVYEPVVEAVMVSAAGTQGISMISPGRILSQTNASPAE